MSLAECIEKEHEIIGISDSFADIDYYGMYPFIKRSEIPRLYFDYIIICVYSRNTYEEIKVKLVADFGVVEEKILSFDSMFMEQRVDQVMQKADGEKYDGLVLGCSHAQRGIMPSLLPGKWSNLARPSEDIYTHEKVFEKICGHYGTVIENLHHVIIDMFDYQYFEWDWSLSGLYIKQLSNGGYAEDRHNFDSNINYDNHDVEALLKEYGAYSSMEALENRELRSLLFDEKKVFNFYEQGIFPGHYDDQYLDFYRAKTKMTSLKEDFDLPSNLYIINDHYPKTVKENVESLNRLICRIRKLGESINIWFVLLPRYFVVEEYHEKMLLERKHEFYEIVSGFQSRYGIKMLDYKGCNKISRNRYFYADPAHLNYVGAVAFTTILSKDING